MDRELYKRVKDKTELLAMMKLPIRGKQYVHVYIWANNEAMHKNYIDDREFAAAYCGLAYYVNVDTGEALVGNKFGEIHLVNSEFGGGIWAHELQHFILDWMDFHTTVYNEIELEEICLITGDMTNKFWTWFYDNFEVEAQ